MIDAFDPTSVLEAAQQAIGAGNYEAAERLLREAAAIQEASLGPLHPELASTLNNLAMVCERSDKLAEAERGYRRAHAIAVASLAPGHPFVATSLKNLLDFCAARGIPVWTPPAVNPGAGAPPPGHVATPPPEEAFEPETREVPPPSRRNVTPRVIALAALSAGVLVAVLFTMQWRGGGNSSERSFEAQRTSPPNASPTTRSTQETTRRQTPGPVERPQQPRTTTTPAAVTVLDAHVCSALERRGSPDWKCTPVSGSDEPGTFMFYTRLLTDKDTTVEHRWYRAGRVHQLMRLRVRANQSSGYRTFSSNSVSSERAGDWKVELRAADGTLLKEEHFVVR